MPFRHIWAITRKEIHHIIRDRSTLILVLITPTALLLLMAYALTVDLQDVPIAILDYDQSQTSQSFFQRFLVVPISMCTVAFIIGKIILVKWGKKVTTVDKNQENVSRDPRYWKKSVLQLLIGLLMGICFSIILLKFLLHGCE